MTTLRIGQSVDFKPTKGLGGWRTGGMVTGFVGKLYEVTHKGTVYPLPSKQVRAARDDAGVIGVVKSAMQRAKIQESTCLAEEAGERPDEWQRTGLLLPIPRETKPVRIGKAMEAIRPLSPQPKAQKPTRSQSYMKWVRMQPCAITGQTAEDAHHYTGQTVNRGTATKVSDLYCVPLTHAAHMEFHAHGECLQAKQEAHQRGLGYGALATRVAMLEAALKSLVGYIESKEGKP